MHFQLAFFSRIFDNFQFILCWKYTSHWIIKNGHAVCMCGGELIEVWQETLRAKFKTKNFCISINFWLHKPWIIQFEVDLLAFQLKIIIIMKVNERRASFNVRQRRHCGLVALREGGTKTVCTLVDGENQRCRPNGLYTLLYVRASVSNSSSSSKKEIRCSVIDWWGGGFWWFLITLDKRMLLPVSYVHIQCSLCVQIFWWTLHMQITNRRKQCHMPHTTKTKVFSPRICVK